MFVRPVSDLLIPLHKTKQISPKWSVDEQTKNKNYKLVFMAVQEFPGEFQTSSDLVKELKWVLMSP